MSQKLMTKINKQIESLQNKIEALSGDHLTNTWKRQQEQKRRDGKIDGYQFDIDILEYIKDVIGQRELTALEVGLITQSVSDTIHQYYLWDKASKNPNVCVRALEYPTIRDDTPEWQHKELQQKITRLQKMGINDITELKKAVCEYEIIASKAVKPVDNTQRVIKELTNKARLQQKGDINFTPPEVVERMVELADIDSRSRVLEPSAGIGNIADKVREVTDDVDVIEQMSNFRELLKLKGYRLIGCDFLEFSGDAEYDAVIMNPPFSNNQDIDHVLRAYECVKDGGVLVSITSPHWTFANDKKSKGFREWIDTQDYFTEHLRGGTFEATGVASEIIVIRKAA